MKSVAPICCFNIILLLNIIIIIPHSDTQIFNFNNGRGRNARKINKLNIVRYEIEINNL